MRTMMILIPLSDTEISDLSKLDTRVKCRASMIGIINDSTPRLIDVLKNRYSDRGVGIWSVDGIVDEHVTHNVPEEKEESVW